MADAEHPVGQQQHAEVPPAAEAAPAAAAAPAVAAAATAAAAESQPQPAPAAGSKRPLEEAADGAAADGYDAAAKRQQVAPAAEPTAAPAAAPASAPAVTNPASVPRETVYRLVMDVVDTALIIGRGGATVRTIEQTTGARASSTDRVGRRGCHLRAGPGACELDPGVNLPACCPCAAGGRVKRLQEPPGARQQTLVIWSQAKELPAPGRASLNTAQASVRTSLCVPPVPRTAVARMRSPSGARAQHTRRCLMPCRWRCWTACGGLCSRRTRRRGARRRCACSSTERRRRGCWTSE